MAEITQRIFIDDLDGAHLDDDDHERIDFSVNGRNYRVDLSKANAEKMREDLAKWIDIAATVKTPGTRASSRRTGGSRRTSRELAQIRDWARAEGYEVSDRGRIAGHIQDAYDAAKK